MSNETLLKKVEDFSQFVDRYRRSWEERIHFSLDEQPSGALRLNFTNAAQTGNGDGSRFMDWLTKMADDENVTLDLIAMADEPQFQHRLIAFYERNGFSRKGNQFLMTREPHAPD